MDQSERKGAKIKMREREGTKGHLVIAAMISIIITYVFGAFAFWDISWPANVNVPIRAVSIFVAVIIWTLIVSR